jgi:hypothetical protein
MGMIAALFALSTRQYILGMLILSYCQIQLAEAMIWRGIDTSNPDLNRTGTSYAKYTLPSHLLFVGLGIAISTYLSGKVDLVPFLVGIIFYFGVVGFYRLKRSIKKGTKEPDMSFPSDQSCIKRECQNNENRLQWPFVDDWYLIQTILLFIVFAMYLPVKSAALLISFFTITYAISKVAYTWSSSSIWCFLSAVLAPVLVVLNLQKN